MSLVAGFGLEEGVADEFGFEALAILARGVGGVLQAAAAEVEGVVEVSGETERAGAAQGVLMPTLRRSPSRRQTGRKFVEASTMRPGAGDESIVAR